MKNFIQNGDVLPIELTEDVVSGGVVIKGSLTGVAATHAKAGDTVEVSLSGVYKLPKSAVAIDQGDKVYWNATNANIVKTASGNTLLGAAAETAAETNAEISVRLTG